MHQHARMLGYTYVACLVVLKFNLIQFLVMECTHRLGVGGLQSFHI
jgi:hypothetical protein